MDDGRHAGWVHAVILILEDDELAGEGLALLVRDAGQDAVIFKSLAAAHASGASGMRITAIISDFDLEQGQNGVVAAQELRAAREPVPPVLIVTGSRHRAVEAAARAAGFAMLPKPASPVRLRRWLEQNAPPKTLAPLS